MKQDEFRILTDLLRRYETEVPPGVQTTLGMDLAERIVHKVRNMVNLIPGVPDTQFLHAMEGVGYPLLPLQQDLVSVHLYGINTSKGLIHIPTTAVAA
ncbi:hypothetical protein pEaSNUABM37_00194 [Erwinia phage pEa_SNUABM_37]|nr:hypothetical protein pEaSNUABM37_00194 [Erwinia phage pEa_SNUABM_37]QXO10664.1 hypothetical protein pEaSNUABM48_00194 [Erwinia phage pEa_SNUABM_48]